MLRQTPLWLCLLCCLPCAEGATLSPGNDDFAQRRRLSGGRVLTRGTTLGATVEPYEFVGSWNSVWFSWTAPRDRTFQISLSPGSFVQLAVFTGTSLGALAQVTDSSSQAVVVRARRGLHYQIRVNGTYQGDSDFTLKIRPVVRPPNDDVADAIAFTGTNTIIQGTIHYATLDSGGPIYALGNGNVWYRWEAPNDGLFLASTASEGSGVYPLVYQGTNSLNLTPIGQTISGLKSGSAFYATNGGSYWISANGYSAIVSNFTLTVSAETPPPNDLFENSIVVAGAEVSILGSSLGAKYDSGEPGPSIPTPRPSPTPTIPAPTPTPARPAPTPIPGAPSQSLNEPKFVFPGPYYQNVGYVWYSWIAPATGVYQISAPLITLPQPGGLGVPGSPSDLLLVLSGDSLASLTQVASGISFRGVLLRAGGGTTYHIAVPGGKSSFQFTIKPVQLPPNDDYTNAIVLTGPLVNEQGSTLHATPEPSDPYSDAAVWYRWIAPSNGFFAVTVLPINHGLRIYSGDEFTTAQLLSWTDNRPVLPGLTHQKLCQRFVCTL